VKKLLNDRRIARCITAAVILASFLGGGARTLGRMSADVAGIFYNGVNGDGMGIQRELEHRANFTQNMVTVANRYIDGDAAVEKAAAAREDLINAGSIKLKSEKNRNLTDAAAELYERLGREKLSENDARLRESLFTEIKARNVRMSNDEYNKKAREFNQKLHIFPASVIRVLRFAPELPIF